MLTSKNLMIAVLLVAAGNISALDRERVELIGDEIALTPREQAAQDRRAKEGREELLTRRERIKGYMRRGQENIPTSEAAWLAHKIADEHLLTQDAYRFAKKARTLEAEEAGGPQFGGMAGETLFSDSDN